MKNQALIVMDSLRFDVFDAANCPFLKQFHYEKAYTHGTYTLPAHTAFFHGRLPHTTTQQWGPTFRQWVLDNPESIRGGEYVLGGKNIIEGFSGLGLVTIGTGAVGWFDTGKPAYIPAIDSFDHYRFFGRHVYAQEQLVWLLGVLKATGSSPYFLFANFGETHHSYRMLPTDTGTAYGDFDRCFEAQKRCCEYLDEIVAALVSFMPNSEIFVTADHGECMGEGGYWGHSICHEKVLEVPLLKINT